MDDLAAAVDELRSTNDPRRLEGLADMLGAIGDVRAISALLHRLGDSIVQDDADVENAVGDALVYLGVMRRLGNLNFRFVRDLAPPTAQWIEANIQTIPQKYFASETTD
jgi:hypothetical protein